MGPCDMSESIFFKDPELPFVECRYSVNSGRHYKTHLHRRFSIGAIDRGEVAYQVAGESSLLKPGSLALINPDVLHACNPAARGKRSYFVLYLEVDWCLQLQQSLWQVDHFVPVQTVLLTDDALYQQYITMMHRFMYTRDLLVREDAVMEFVEQIFRRCCGRKKIIQTSCSQVLELKKILHSNLEVPLTLNQVAEELQVNPYTLLRHFKAEIGITPHAYRLNCRIEHARQLLQRGVEPGQVALESGFFDQSHFHRHFKAMTTVTPREYQVNFVQ